MSPCQGPRPQDRFFGRKFSSRSIRIVANVQLQTAVAVGRGVSLDRLFVGVATQEEIILQYSIVNTISTKKCCPVHYDLNAKLIVIETWREHFVTRSSWINCALQDDEAVYWVNMDTLRQ